MNIDELTVLFSALRCAIDGVELSVEEKAFLSNQSISNLIAVAKKHDVMHLLVYGFIRNKISLSQSLELETHLYQAVYRYELINYEYTRLCCALENANIRFIPLKGSVMRNYYPEPWMRTSCDIDILVGQDDCQRAVKILSEECGYTCGRIGNHDISLTTPQDIHIELHYTLRRDGKIKNASEILERVWDESTPEKGHKYWLKMTDEMFYFHHIAHMAKHFQYGGCGIRPYLDLWILDNMADIHTAKRDEMLAKGGLLDFANSCRKLSRIWFEGEAMDIVSERMQEYVLTGGVYGSSGNRIAVQQHLKGGKLKYVMSKVFLSYDELKYHYPVLQKKRWLTPIMEVRRWGKHLFGRDAGRAITELKTNQSSGVNNKNDIKELISSVGL